MPIKKYLPLIIIGVLAINVPVFIFLAEHQQDIRQHASEVVNCSSISPEKIGAKPQPLRKTINASYSAQIKSLLSTYRTADQTSRTQLRQQLHSTLDARKTALIETMRSNPQAALDQIKAAQNQTQSQSDLTSLTSNCLETKTQLSGTVTVEHVDYLDKTSKDIDTLTTKDNRTVVLHNPTNYPRQLYSGAKLTASGYLMDQEFLVTSDQPVVLANDIPPLLQDSAPKTRKLAVLLVNFSNTTMPTITKSDATNVLSQVVAFHKENSYGKVVFAPSIFGWYQLSIPESCSDTSTISNAAMSAANNDVNFLDYDHVMIVAPFGNCGWSGLGDVGIHTRPTPDGSKTLGFTFIDTLPNYLSPNSMDHELGHNLGAYHAAFGDNVYGDIYDVMGGFTGEMNIAHKDVIGVLGSSDLPNVTSDGSYTLTPLESQSSGVKGIKIDTGATGIYYVEYRQPLGADTVYTTANFPGINAFNGAMIHKYLPVADNTIDTYLVDPTSPQSAETATLPLNETYSIPGTNVKIKTTSLNSSALTVSITGMASVTQNPTQTPTPSPSQTLSTISGSLYVDNNADAIMDTGDFVYTSPTSIELHKDDGSQTYPLLVQSVTSNSNGDYAFSPVTQGNYAVKATIPTNYSVVSGNPVYLTVSSKNINLDFGLKVVTSPTPTHTPTLTPTRTPSPTISQIITPTNTPTPNDPHLVFSLLLHGIGKAGDNSNPGSGGIQNPKDKRINAVFTFTNLATNVTTPITVPLDYTSSSGSYTGGFYPYSTTLSLGKYKVGVSIPKYLQIIYPQTITLAKAQTTTFPVLSLTVGDINNDNRINILDYDILLGCIQNTSCNQTEKSQSDLNDDGVTNQDDLNLFLREIYVLRGDSI